MDFESAMQTFAEAWMAANRSGLPVLGSDNSNSNNKNKTLPMNLVENSTRSADHEEKVRKNPHNYCKNRHYDELGQLICSSDPTTNSKTMLRGHLYIT